MNLILSLVLFILIYLTDFPLPLIPEREIFLLLSGVILFLNVVRALGDWLNEKYGGL